jgi:alpha-glucosidase (family GH31 glycosyl hydrolase)
MFGPNLLVGIFTDEIYLPAGEWTDAWTGEKIRSRGETVKLPYPEGRAGLLLIRGGAILPTMEPADYIGTRPQRKFIVKVYPCGESEYVLRDCDAESYGYEEGLVACTRFRCAAGGKGVKLTVDPVEGRFENMPETRDYRFEVALDRKPSRVLVNGQKTKDWIWSGRGSGAGTLCVSAGSCPVTETLTLTIL